MNHIHCRELKNSPVSPKIKFFSKQALRNQQQSIFTLGTCCAVRDKSRIYEEMNVMLHRISFLKLQVRGAPITPQR